MSSHNFVLQKALSELRSGRSVVLCTLIEVRGSAPQSVPAHLLVMEDDQTAGTIGGGCIEGDVWFKADTNRKRGVKFDTMTHTLNEEIAADNGLTCGGTVRFMLELISPDEAEIQSLQSLLDASEGKSQPTFTLTVINSSAETNQPAGSKFNLSSQAGQACLSALSPSLFSTALENVNELSDTARGKLFRDTAHRCSYFIELYSPPQTVYVLGAGHVGAEVAKLAHFLAMQVVVVDDRAEFADSGKFPYAAVHADTFSAVLPDLNIATNGNIVIVTRGHKDDLAALQAALATDAGYIGLMGSKRKVILLYKELSKLGYSRAALDRLHAPIGLSVGATSPAEIAVSILAEIMAFRSGQTGVSKRQPVDELKNIFPPVGAHAN